MGQRFTRLRKALAATAIAGLLGAATACGSTGQGAQADGVVDYWLWDSAQQPGYQQCADAFQQENPDVRVRITQYQCRSVRSTRLDGQVRIRRPATMLAS